MFYNNSPLPISLIYTKTVKSQHIMRFIQSFKQPIGTTNTPSPGRL